MDKIAKPIFLFSVAVTVALVMGKQQDDDPLKSLFAGAGPNVWPPMMKWGRPGPPYPPPVDSGSVEYDGEYGGQPDVDQGGSAPLSIVKRSHARQPVCEVLLNMVYVGNGTDGYEYRPNHYVTESCLGSYNNFQNKCTETGLSCTQIRQKIYITRRKATPADSQPTNCWEHVALKEIDAGCECMWPKEHIGDKHSFRLGK
uniref:Spaetzle domain-containing protein n=1 Tax=Anopheles atroparvus TaxID=41427 RepID=A0AAG5DC94_ANOAO